MKKTCLLLLVFLSAAYLQAQSKRVKKANPMVSTYSSLWTQCQGLPNNLPITGFAASGNNLVAGTYDPYLSYIYISFDNGATWSVDTAFHVYNKSPFDHLYLATPVTFLAYSGYLFAGIGGAYRGDIYRSTDNGVTWSDRGIVWPESDSNGTEDINGFSSIGGSIFAGTDHGVFLSTDYGMNWKAVNTGFPPLAPFGFAPQALRIAAQGTDLFVGGTSLEGIFFSSNSGASWTAVDSGLTNTSKFIAGLAAIGSKIFAGVFETSLTGGVFVTTNNGSSWNPVDTGLKDHKIDILTSSGTFLFAGTNSELFLSTNEGAMWYNISNGTPIDSLGTGIGTIAVINSQLFVGGNWYGAWHCPITQITSFKTPQYATPTSYFLMQNYPNPANPSTVISYQLPVSSLVTLKVYDLLGRLVNSLIEERQSAGIHSVTFDANSLSSGAYFYRLTTGSFVETKKLMLIK
jgi:hypothetical protein